MTSFRQAQIQRLSHTARVDVLILGGGVSGVSTLRELTLNGVSAVLIERNDFCAGATGASTRLAHGGLRYLENRELSLVADAVKERNLLLQHAAHLVKPIAITIPVENRIKGFFQSTLKYFGLSRVVSNLNSVSLMAALTLYSWLSKGTFKLPNHRFVWRTSKIKKGLADRFSASATYYDAKFINPEALVFEILEQALRQSPNNIALNHVNWRLDDDDTSEYTSFTILDKNGAILGSVIPTVVVNATGAWVDRTNSKLSLSTEYVTAVQGTHLVLDCPELFTWLDGSAQYFPDQAGRMLICYPLNRTVLIGTTEHVASDPSSAATTKDEIIYLLKGLNSLLSTIRVGHEHILGTTSGCRPLIRQVGGNVNSAKRAHTIHRDFTSKGVPVLSIAGGKWTIFRSMAVQISDEVMQLLGVCRSVDTEQRVYPGWSEPKEVDKLIDDYAQRFGLTNQRVGQLYERYGYIRLSAVAEYCAQHSDKPLDSAPHYTEREIEWLVSARGAQQLDDLLLRRTQLALDGYANRACLQELSLLMARMLGESERWAADAVASCLHSPAFRIERKDDKSPVNGAIVV